MKNADQPAYRKILRFKGTPFGRSGVFAGDDHLLLVNSTGYAEDYRRFFYNEIEAVTARRTHRRRNIALVAGAFFLLCVIPLPWMRDPEGIGVLVFFAFFPFVILIWNQLLGPTVQCAIRTSASLQIIPTVTRLRTYWKFLERIRPLIEGQQGGRLEQFQLIARFGAKSGTTGTPQ